MERFKREAREGRGLAEAVCLTVFWFAVCVAGAFAGARVHGAFYVVLYVAAGLYGWWAMETVNQFKGWRKQR